MNIQPSRRLHATLSTWEVRDNRNKLVGTFEANKDKTRDKFDKLAAVTEVINIKNDLLSVKERIKDLFLKNDEWQVCDRAMQAASQTKTPIVELEEIINHIKQS